MMVKRRRIMACLSVLVVCVSGCLIGTIDNVGRAGSDAVIVLGWREMSGCTPSKGAANATLGSVKITMGDREAPVLAIRDIIDMEVETAPNVKMPPPLQYRIARIRIPANMPAGKTTVHVFCDGKELTEHGISPIEFEVLPGPGRTEADVPAAKGLK